MEFGQGGLLKIKSFFQVLRKSMVTVVKKCEQILLNCIYLRRAKAWVPNSTMSRQRQNLYLLIFVFFSTLKV